MSRPTRRLVAALAGMLLLAGAPAPAAAAGASAFPAAAADTPAGARLAALAKGDVGVRPLLLPGGTVPSSSPTTGTLGDAAPDAVYLFELERGQRLRLTLDVAPDADFDLYLLWPDAGELDGFHLAAAAVSSADPEELTFDAAWPGVYQLDVRRSSGEGDFSLAWSVTGAVGDGSVTRISGADRYETAVAASRRMFRDATSRDVVLASGESFADSLTASGLAGALGCPLLLTGRERVSAAVRAEIERLGAVDLHIVGGLPAVSQTVEDALCSGGRTARRYAGRDRYLTAAAVASAVAELSVSDPEVVFVARGDLFPDALAVSPLAYSRGFPILLTRSDALTPVTASTLNALSPETVMIAGWEAAVGSDVEAALRRLPGPERVIRVGGKDRFHTASEVARYAVEHYWAVPDLVGVASGLNFPDAVCGGAATGVLDGVLVLSTDVAVPPVTRTFLSEHAGLGLIDTAAIYGGPAAVSGEVEDAVKGLVRR